MEFELVLVPKVGFYDICNGNVDDARCRSTEIREPECHSSHWFFSQSFLPVQEMRCQRQVS